MLLSRVPSPSMTRTSFMLYCFGLSSSVFVYISTCLCLWSCHYCITLLCSPVLCFSLISLVIYIFPNVSISHCEVLPIVLWCSEHHFSSSMLPACVLTPAMGNDYDSWLYALASCLIHLHVA